MLINTLKVKAYLPLEVSSNYTRDYVNVDCCIWTEQTKGNGYKVSWVWVISGIRLWD